MVGFLASMNDRQKTIVWITVVLVFATGFYPPWISDTYHSRYAWLFLPPSTMKLDSSRLAVEWILILVLASATLFAPLKAEGVGAWFKKITSFAAKTIVLVVFLLLIALLVTFGWWLYQTYSVPPPPQYEGR
jgi:hypothetical protein